MEKRDFETKTIRYLRRTEGKVTDIYNLLRDLNAKLCHIIKDKRSYYDMLEGTDPLDQN